MIQLVLLELSIHLGVLACDCIGDVRTVLLTKLFETLNHWSRIANWVRREPQELIAVFPRCFWVQPFECFEDDAHDFFGVNTQNEV